MNILIFLLSIFSFNTYAAETYTTEEVATHNTSSDCWMIYDTGVYDITSYINQHDKYLDIREWCGIDMTEDFETKAGLDRDHKASSYELLKTFYIGRVSTVTTTTETVDEEGVVVEEEVDQTEEIEEETTEGQTDEDGNAIIALDSNTEKKGTRSTNPYNLLLPFLSTVIIYIFSYLLSKKKELLKKFNAFWNTILFTTLIVPAFGFGIFMILRYSYPELWNIDFDFTYWHVELSVVMGTVAVCHFIQRFRMYLIQLKK